MCFLSACPAQAQVRINLLPADCVDAPSARSGTQKRPLCGCSSPKCVVLTTRSTNGGASPRKSSISGDSVRRGSYKSRLFFAPPPSVFTEPNLTVSHTGRDVRASAGSSSNNKHSRRVQTGHVIQRKQRGKSTQEQRLGGGDWKKLHRNE